MSFFSAVGLSTIVYFLFYIGFLAASDCDVRLFWASKFGKRNIEKFRGKVIWITGASSGIGEFIALILAKHGAKIVITARNESQLMRVKQDCVAAGASPENILILPMDVTDIKQHQHAFNQVLHHFGELNVLINNAGRSQRAEWENIDLQVDRDMFELNTFAIVSLSRIVGKYFLSRNSGHLAVTSSIAGVVGSPFSPTYSGTKFALHGYFGSFLKEKLSSNVKVTLLCPGPVFSNLLPACFTENPGETYGESHKPTDKRMSTERCAYLSVIAISNNLTEAWMAKFPILLFAYLSVYFPNFSLWILKLMGTERLQKLRDNRVTVRQV